MVTKMFINEDYNHRMVLVIVTLMLHAWLKTEVKLTKVNTMVLEIS